MNVRFNRGSSDTFHQDLNQRVNQYFKSNNISKHGDSSMVAKSVILVALYFAPYFLLLFAPLPLWGMWLLCAVMGIALAGIGMSLMHDACHGAYSSNRKLNLVLSYSMNVIGGNRFNWSIQHNVKHHTYTNIYGVDEDLHNGNVIRFSPHSQWLWFHRLQHIYTWLLYLLGTLSWVTIKDFKQFNDIYQERSERDNTKYGRELVILITSKILYYTYMMVIPILVLDIPFLYVLIGFLTIHFVAGFILSITFQLAHVVEDISHESAFEKSVMDDSWAIHQLKTTCNFARKSQLLNWYLGGLNFQIEHHLYPNICHIHYRKLSDIVKNTAEEHNIQYHEYPNMFQAMLSHYRTLKRYSLKPEKLKASFA